MMSAEEVLTGLSDDEKLPILSNIPKAVGKLQNTRTGSSGTAFIATTTKHGRKVPAIFSAGHNFKQNGVLPQDLNFAEFTLKFCSSSSPSPSLSLDVVLELLPTTTLVCYKSVMLVLEGGTVIHTNKDCSDTMDYFVMILNDREGDHGSAMRLVKTQLGLEPLDCGEGAYLEAAPGTPVAVFGFPAVGLLAEELRWSMGVEMDLNHLESQRILYNNDTLPGNSGSPIISLGKTAAMGMSYIVKGIHVQGFSDQQFNAAQSLVDILPIAKSYIL